MFSIAAAFSTKWILSDDVLRIPYYQSTWLTIDQLYRPFLPFAKCCSVLLRFNFYEVDFTPQKK